MWILWVKIAVFDEFLMDDNMGDNYNILIIK